MADCGASGTVIDRAVTALSGQSAAAGKHVSSLLGHMAVGNHLTAMPMTAPSQLYHHSAPSQTTFLDSSHLNSLHAGSQHDSALDQVWSQQRQQHPFHTATMPPIQQQALMQHQMRIQQDHMMQVQYMMQQQQLHQRLLHQQQLLNDVQVIQKVDTANADPVVGDWDEGLYDNIAQGATIESLSAAWAQAEAEYDCEAAAVDLASGYGVDGDQLPYQFQNSLPDTHEHDKDWMDVGLNEYNRGNLPEAIHAFETLVQMQDDHAKGWYYLGKCHAENDLDVQAIACLERSVERDPFSPETLLALGVSHVNELNYKKALQNLKEWITHNPKYADLPSDDLYGCAADESELDQVQGLLLRALEHEASPDVHEALGVVYNVSRDYEAAVASFERALSQRPQEYSLWNKLGATLANSNSSERALPAYNEALKLRPKYARAWLNMAISHSNLQNYDQAARCYLQTLSLNPSATHCWSYLRIALSCQEQWDLLPLVSNQDLKAFKKYYDFVLYE